MEKNIKNLRKEFKEKGVFYTDKKLASMLRDLIDIDVSEVYDPTCGCGNLLSVFPDNVKKYGQELDENELQKCKKNLKNFTGFAGDTLQHPYFINRKFNCIVSNYPFSIEWEPKESVIFKECGIIPTKGRADYCFLLHILYLLSDDGVAVTLNFPGILYRGGREGKIRKRIIEQNYIDKIIQVPSGYFVDTNISTVIIVFKKNKKDTNIYFEDMELGMSRIVSLDDIGKNNYCLSVSNYIQKKEKKEEINPKILQSRARNEMRLRLKHDILVDKMICELEGWDYKEYINGLIIEIKKLSV